jgi:hypothetical protein
MVGGPGWVSGTSSCLYLTLSFFVSGPLLAIMVGMFGIHVLTWTGTIPHLHLLFRKG